MTIFTETIFRRPPQDGMFADATRPFAGSAIQPQPMLGGPPSPSNSLADDLLVRLAGRHGAATQEGSEFWGITSADVEAAGAAMFAAKEDRVGRRTPDEMVAQAFGDDLPQEEHTALTRQPAAARTAQQIELRTNIGLAERNAPDAIARNGAYAGKMPGRDAFRIAYGLDEGDKRFQDFDWRAEVGRQVFGMRTMPSQAIHAVLRDAEPGPGSSEEERARFRTTAAAALKTLGMRRADPAGYVREIFPNVDAAWSAATRPDSKPENGDAEAYKWAIALSVAAQRQLGVENPQPLPSAVLQSLVETFGNEDVSQTDKDIAQRDLLAAAPNPDVRHALFRQLNRVGLSVPTQVDPIITAATAQQGGHPSGLPGDARSSFQQVADDFGNYLSEGFEALGRAPAGFEGILRDLRDDPLDAIEKMPVTPGSGLAAEGAAGLRWMGANLLKGGKIADELIEPALKAFSKNYRKTFFKEYPELAGMVFIHHRIEQKVLKRYIGVITNEMMHSLQNLRGIPKELNSTLHLSTIRREWDAFYRQNPTTTLQKLLEKAAEIDEKYGHLFNPPIGKK